MKKRECDRCKEDLPYNQTEHRFSCEVKPRLYANIVITNEDNLDLCRTCLREIIYKDI
jgi:ribosomal protein S14